MPGQRTVFRVPYFIQWTSGPMEQFRLEAASLEDLIEQAGAIDQTRLTNPEVSGIRWGRVRKVTTEDLGQLPVGEAVDVIF